VVCEPKEFLLGTPRFAENILPACSGFEGMGLILVFLAAFLAWFRRSLRFPQSLALLPAGIVLMWASNIVRLVALIELGTWWSPRVAIGGFHSQAGWLAFNAVAIGMILVVRRSPLWIEAGSPPKRAEIPCARANSPIPYLLPMMAIVLATILASAAGDGRGFDRLYPIRLAAFATAIWICRRSYAEVHFRLSWTGIAGGAAVYALWKAMEPLAPSASAESSGVIASSLAALPPAVAGAWVVARILGSVIAVPVAEELAFRGYLARRITAADFPGVEPRRISWPGLLVSSLLFGVLHGRWIAGAAAGLAYAGCYMRRGRLGDAILAHATTNALIAADVLLLSGDWTLWS
jgi:exosortase E/protease (VPEID-CTERM system)